MTIYHIDITNGVIRYTTVITDGKISVKQYFAEKGRRKPSRIPVVGYPFGAMYIVHGTEENGLAIAIA